MRLTAAEQLHIAEAARAVLPPGTRVALFGSRTDDTQRGGDIDLLVETAAAQSIAQSVRLQIRFMAQLYWRMGERQIDVLTATLGEADGRPVVANARRDGIELACT